MTETEKLILENQLVMLRCLYYMTETRFRFILEPAILKTRLTLEPPLPVIPATPN